jgi:hypothetical protein
LLSFEEARVRDQGSMDTFLHTSLFNSQFPKIAKRINTANFGHTETGFPLSRE